MCKFMTPTPRPAFPIKRVKPSARKQTAKRILIIENRTESCGSISHSFSFRFFRFSHLFQLYKLKNMNPSPSTRSGVWPRRWAWDGSLKGAAVSRRHTPWSLERVVAGEACHQFRGMAVEVQRLRERQKQLLQSLQCCGRIYIALVS